MTASYTTIKKLCEEHPSLCEDLVRKHVIEADTNGLEESGAVLRLTNVFNTGQYREANHKDVMTKDMINDERYFDWLYSQTRLLGNCNERVFR